MSAISVFDHSESSHSAWRGYLQSARAISNASDANDPFAKFAASWPTRAAVKNREPHLDAVFQNDLPDFLISLLPFHKHADFLRADHHLQQQALSCGWLAYNAKTIGIESRIITPACMHVVDDEVPGISGRHHRESVSQAIVDEAYHILLTSNACDITRQKRGLEHLSLPKFALVLQMQKSQEEFNAPWQRILIQLATAIVSELLISDYLRLLSDAPGIQPLNVLTTAIHRLDESAHNGLFKTLGGSVFSVLNEKERSFFIRALARPMRWFEHPEWNVWRQMLKQINFPNAERMLDECQADVRPRGHVLDDSSLQRLMEEIDIDPEVLKSVQLSDV
jgi:P-aminobenzoate N-oxygenase AurF